MSLAKISVYIIVWVVSQGFGCILVCAQQTRGKVNVIQSVRQPRQARPQHDGANKDAAWDAIDSLREVTGGILFGTYYDSKMTFWGRDFGEKQFGLTPYVVLSSPLGLYIYGVNNYWSANAKQPARTDLGIGYETNLGKKVYLSMGYERWFARYGDDYYNSLLIHNIELSAVFELPWFDVAPSVYYMFGENHVLQTDIAIEKQYLIPLSKICRLSFKPSLLTTFATRTFIPMYSEFDLDQIDYNKIALVDYEATAMLGLEIRNLEMDVAGHYNIPIGVGYEELSPFSYLSIHVSYDALFLRK